MWQPMSEDKLRSLITKGETAMEPALLAFWQQIRMRPAKWALPPWGDVGGGFWVVAVVGQECVWYNDIEDGFNVSRYKTPGRIADYWCNQSELHHCIAGLFAAPDRGDGGSHGR